MAFQKYHAHLYYNQGNLKEAEHLAQQAHYLFGVEVGTFHQRPVGPHPAWSCQLSLRQEVFAEIIPWLMANRGTVHVFVHADTGRDYLDHTAHTMWLGPSYQLNLERFRRLPQAKEGQPQEVRS